MTERIIDLSEEPAALSVRNEQLIIRRSEQEDVSVPMEDIAAIVVSHPQVNFTHAVLSRLSELGGVFIVCDSRRLPAGMILPFQNHSTQSEKFQNQASASAPLKKRLWQQTIKAKILAQAHLLEHVSGDDRGLRELAKNVRSGDPENLEGQASRIYWPNLFGTSFRRNFEVADQNQHLNYGYAIVRGIVARAICATGLHPCLGLHHHNRYNPFCLADDIMEPFRPVVDWAVWQWDRQHERADILDTDAKRDILKTLSFRYNMNGHERTLFDIASRVAASLGAVFLGERKTLLLPKPLAPPENLTS